MDFELVARRSVVVYLKNMRQARQLRRFGVVEYISEKMKYAVIAMNDQDIAAKVPLIERLGFVREVKLSHWPEVDPTVGGNNQDNYELAVDPVELADEPVDEEEL